MILKKWRSVFYHNLDASSVGQQLQQLDSNVEQLGVLEEVFAGKSDGTLSKHVNSLTKFVQFLAESASAGLCMHPLSQS